MLVLLFSAFNAEAAAFNMEGKVYEGIGKLAGQPLDFWTTVTFDDEDADISIAGAFTLSGAYTATKTGQTVSLSVKMANGKSYMLKSTDGGSSFQGDVTLNGQTVKLWVLEVAATHKAADLTPEELKNILTSPDGYTSFIIVGINGGKMSVTSDFTFNSDGTYTLTCDSPAIQKIFGNAKGTFTVGQSYVTLTDSTGKTVTGKIYDNGTYIDIPFGTSGGTTLSMVLIR